MGKMGRKQAVAAATLMGRVKRPLSQIALDRLSAFAAEQDLFEHGEADDWEIYDTRCRMEREVDPVVLEARVFRLAQAQDIEARTQAAVLNNPKFLLKEAEKAAKKKADDPTSVDWKDPNDEGRTKLHKHVLDQNIHEIKRYVEVLHADPGILDNNGHTPLQLAINEGYLKIASYLKEVFAKHVANADVAIKIA